VGLSRSAQTTADFRRSFKSIDPTPCHASAHPHEHASTIAFSVRDSESESPSTVTVGEITTRHIRRLRTSASDYTGKTVTSAVVAVPTDSTDEQKDALTKAFGDAQIEVLQFIPEPIAAVLAYDARAEQEAKDKLIVVADLGGNRSDVAIVASRGGMYSVLATAHDYMLGGAQLDQVLINHFAKEFMKKHKTDPRSDSKSLAKLKLEAETVKKALSQSASATFSVESLADGIDFRATVNRTRYELLAAKIFPNFRRLNEDAVRKAGLEVLDIDEVSGHTE
jgi:molecular chaperone DnaK (HSP70)